MDHLSLRLVGEEGARMNVRRSWKNHHGLDLNP